MVTWVFMSCPTSCRVFSGRGGATGCVMGYPDSSSDLGTLRSAFSLDEPRGPGDVALTYSLDEAGGHGLGPKKRRDRSPSRSYDDSLFH